MGLWYEIAHYENRFEYGLVDVTATSLRPDGMIRVENQGMQTQFSLRYLQDCQRTRQIPDPTQPGKLKCLSSLFLL